MISAYRSAPALLCAAILSGCAALTPEPEIVFPPERPGVSETAWQRVRFRVRWNRDEEPKWHIDALLAHRIAGPALERERKSIVLWRFHRRANEDAAGHSFSVLSFAPRETNDALCRSLRTDGQTTAMIDAGLIDKVECEGFSPEREGRVEGTSDARWSPALQRAWPYFIMGVSETWLRLVDERARQSPETTPAVTLDQVAQRYEAINRAVTEGWRKEGEHAFLHHLNGLFGYEPIEITEKVLRRF
jgi:hypothetical protein